MILFKYRTPIGICLSVVIHRVVHFTRAPQGRCIHTLFICQIGLNWLFSSIRIDNLLNEKDLFTKFDNQKQAIM